MNIEKFERLTGGVVVRNKKLRKKGRVALVMRDGVRIEGRTVRACMQRATELALLDRWPEPYDEDLR